MRNFINPSVPAIYGFEWVAARKVVNTMAIENGGYAITVYPRVSEDLSSFSLAIEGADSTNQFILDIYEGELEEVIQTANTTSHTTVNPQAIMQNWGNVVDEIGDVILISDLTTEGDGHSWQFTVGNAASTSQQVHVNFNAGGFAAGTRILQTWLEVTWFGEAGPMIVARRTGPQTWSPFAGIYNSQPQLWFVPQETNPLTRTIIPTGELDVISGSGIFVRGWTDMQLRQFSSVAATNAFVFATSVVPTGVNRFVGPVYMDYLRWHMLTTDETRVRYGIGSVSFPITTFQDLLDPQHQESGFLRVTPWRPLTLIVRPAMSSFQPVELRGAPGGLQSVDSGISPPNVNMQFSAPEFDSESGRVTGTGVKTTQKPSFYATFSDIKQPYYSPSDAYVNGTTTALGSFIPTSGVTYSHIRFRVGVDQFNAPTDSLRVQVHHESGSPIVTTQLTYEEWADLPFAGPGYRTAVLELSSPIVGAAALDWTVVFTSDTDVGSDWTILYLNRFTTSSGDPLIESRSIVNNLPSTGFRVLSVEFLTEVSPPTSLVGSLQSLPVTGVCEPACAWPCETTGIPFTRLTWAAPAVTGISGYEVQRSDTFDAEWQTIAAIRSPYGDGLHLTGESSTGSASTPDNAALDITSDIELRVAARFGRDSPAVVPSGNLAQQMGAGLLGKWNTGQESYMLSVVSNFDPPLGTLDLPASDQRLLFSWTTDGSTDLQAASVPLRPLIAGKPYTYRVTFDANSFVAADFTSAGISTPDVAALDIIGDIDIAALVALEDWDSGFDQTIVSKWDATAAGSSWKFGVNLNGPYFKWTTNGTTTLTAQGFWTTNMWKPLNNHLVWLRVVLDVNTSYTPVPSRVTFYGSLDGVTWSSFSGTPFATTTSIFSGSAAVVIGRNVGGAAEQLTGRVARVTIRNGVAGTIVANPDFTLQTPGAGSFVDSTGKTWTVNAGAAINSGRQVTFYALEGSDIDNTAAFEQLWFPTVGDTTSIFSGTAALRVGNSDVGNAAWPGYVESARVYNAIGGTVVANPNFSVQTPGATGFTDGAGRVWTVNADATIEDPWPAASLTFDDYEQRLCVDTSYRVRTLGPNDIFSDWVTLGSPITVTGAVSALYLTSNSDRDVSLVVQDVYDRTVLQSYTFLNDEEVQVLRLYGRDYQIAVQPLEERGVRFERTIILDSLCLPACGKRDNTPFKPLTQLARARLPYICVRDSSGSRWFASIRVPDGAARNPLRGTRINMSKIAITQVTDVSTVVER